MCLTIDEKATQPRNRIVYKVLMRETRLTTEGFRTRTRSFHNEEFWKVGEVKRIPISTQVYRSALLMACRFTVGGFYVYLSRRRALYAFRSYRKRYPRRSLVLARCEVAPADWIFSGQESGLATYRGIKLLSKQSARDIAP